jgi:hypothetical protein
VKITSSLVGKVEAEEGSFEVEEEGRKSFEGSLVVFHSKLEAL